MTEKVIFKFGTVVYFWAHETLMLDLILVSLLLYTVVLVNYN